MSNRWYKTLTTSDLNLNNPLLKAPLFSKAPVEVFHSVLQAVMTSDKWEEDEGNSQGNGDEEDMKRR